jgi:hypothetical protein
MESNPEGFTPDQIEEPIEEKKPGIFERFRNRRQNNHQQESEEPDQEISGLDIDGLRQARLEQNQAQEEARRYERNLNPERIGTPNTPEDLVNLMLTINGVQWRERKLDEKYKGGRLGEFQKLMRGERDFSLDANGQTQRNTWNEFKRKALKVGISTAIGAAAAVGVGVATGGVGLLAFGAIFGSTAAHAGIEAWHSINGKERGLREAMARDDWEQWDEMHAKAMESVAETDETRKNQLIEEVIDARFQTSDRRIELEKETAAETKVWNNRRLFGKLLGGLAGAGLTFGLAHLGDKVMTMDIDGDKTAHLVEKVNDNWHYMYNTVQEATKAAAQGAKLVADAGGHAAHALGSEAWHIAVGVAKNLAPMAGALMGAVFQRGFERTPSDEQIDENFASQREDFEHESARLKGQIPPVPEGGGGGTPENPEASVPPQYIELAREENKTPPEVGKTWVVNNGGVIGIWKITVIDWEGGMLTFDSLDQNFKKVETFRHSIENVIRNGSEKSEFVNNWLITVPDNSKIRVRDGVGLIDRSDHTGKTLVNPDDYTFRRIAEIPGQAEVVKENQEKRRVSIFDLAFWGVRPIEEKKPEVEKTVKAPKPKEKWAKRPGMGDLPPELAGLDENMTIGDVEEGIIYFPNGDKPPVEDINLFVKYYRKVGNAAGGGQEKQQGQERQPRRGQNT